MTLTGNERRQWESRRRDQARKTVNDIGEIPDVFDPERKAACLNDPVLWLTTYHPEIFYLDFSESQEDFIKIAWNAITNRSYQNVNAYRGFGKTSILRCLMEKALFDGLCRYGIYITAEASMGRNASLSFYESMYEPLDNKGLATKPLIQDYPEICYPVCVRDGVAQRPLLYHGAPCNIRISPSEIVFPLIDDTIASGSKILFTSISAANIRGTYHTIRKVGQVRPDIVMIDDVQSDGTAKSETEVNNILDVIKKSIDGLSGYDRKTGLKQELTVLSALTQNQPNDVAVKMITEMPDYCTVIYRFLRSVPDDFSSWVDYRKLRNELYLKHNKKTVVNKYLTNYYKDNQDTIEKNVIVDNPNIFEKSNVNAIHYALEKWCRSEESFWCELQNDAIRASQEKNGYLSPVVVERKSLIIGDNVLKRCYVPKDTKIMTAFIDCGEHYLNYQVTAFGDNFKFAHVVDFGVWPEQGSPITTKSSYSVDLQEVYGNGDTFDRLGDAVIDCLGMIFNQQYFDYTGKPIDTNTHVESVQNATDKPFKFLSVCGVDCSDGEMEIALWRAIDVFHRKDRKKYTDRAIPCYGDEAGYRLIRYYDLDLKKREYRRGGKYENGICDWIENPKRTFGLRRRFANVDAALLYDANTYKTGRNLAWMIPIERDGSATHFVPSDENEQKEIKMFSEHQCSEEYTESRKSNLRYLRWKMKKPRFSDNEFLDTDTGCWALASYCGIEKDSEDCK